MLHISVAYVKQKQKALVTCYTDAESPCHMLHRCRKPLSRVTQMQKAIQEFLDDYNTVNTSQMNLVLFMDAIRHLCRISRIIRQPLGNALLLGVGGSGRQSLTRLAAHM